MKTNEVPETHQIARHEFDLLQTLRNDRTVVRRATVNDVNSICELSKKNIPDSVTCPTIVKKVIQQNHDNIFVFRKNEDVIGGYAMLMLTPIGLEKLLLGELNTSNPDLMSLAKTGTNPAAIYTWSFIAPGLAANGIRYISQILQQPKYKNINIFARPVTEAGIQITLNLGYHPLNLVRDGLYRYVRIINRKPKKQPFV